MNSSFISLQNIFLLRLTVHDFFHLQKLCRIFVKTDPSQCPPGPGLMEQAQDVTKLNDAYQDWKRLFWTSNNCWNLSIQAYQQLWWTAAEEEEERIQSEPSNTTAFSWVACGNTYSSVHSTSKPLLPSLGVARSELSFLVTRWVKGGSVPKG